MRFIEWRGTLLSRQVTIAPSPHAYASFWTIPHGAWQHPPLLMANSPLKRPRYFTRLHYPRAGRCSSIGGLRHFAQNFAKRRTLLPHLQFLSIEVHNTRITTATTTFPWGWFDRLGGAERGIEEVGFPRRGGAGFQEASESR